MERINIDDAVAAFRSLREGILKKASDQDNPDGTSHPTASAPDNTQEPDTGERYSENTSDVNDAISQSVQKADEPSAAPQDNSDSVQYMGAPALENAQGVPPTTDTPKDPGTESKMDVSTEKSASAEIARIANLVKTKGQSAALAELTKQAMDDLGAALKPAAPTKKQAAAAGAQAAGKDLAALFAEDENLQMTKRAAAAAEEYGFELAQGYIPFFFDMMRKKAEEEGMMPPEEGGEGAMPEEDLGALMGMAGGEDPGMGGEMGMGDEMGGMGDMGMGGDEMGGGEEGGGEIGEEELIAAISEALDELGIDPAEMVELEGDVADASGAPEEVKEASMRKAAATMNLVRQYQTLQRRAPGQIKRASAHRSQLVGLTLQNILQKVDFVQRAPDRK